MCGVVQKISQFGGTEITFFNMVVCRILFSETITLIYRRIGKNREHHTFGSVVQKNIALGGHRNYIFQSGCVQDHVFQNFCCLHAGTLEKTRKTENRHICTVLCRKTLQFGATKIIFFNLAVCRVLFSEANIVYTQTHW